MASEHHPNSTGQRGAKTVLVVDDEPDILDLMRIFLQDVLPDVDVLTAPSAAQGLDLLRTARVDLVVSDFRMPGMDGIEFLAGVRAAQPGARRVLFTAYADQDLAERARRDAGVEEVLSKGDPFPQTVRRLEAMLTPPAPSVEH